MSNTVSDRALRAAMAARIPAMIVGQPGIGKTARINAIAEEMGYELITIIGSQMDPTDVAGLPKAEIVGHDDEGEPIWGTVNLAPSWQARIIQKKKVILFLDEFSNSSAAVRASMLNILQKREFPNGIVMPPETIIVGAMNPTESAADGWQLDMPTTNRMMFLAWESDRAEWSEGMLKAWGKEVSAEEMTWRRFIVRFLDDNPTYLHKENGELGTAEAHGIADSDPSKLEVAKYAWASRRSWDNLATVLGVTPNETIVEDTIIKGLVGNASAIAFREWLEKNKTISPQEVLDDPEAVDWSAITVNEANLLFRAITDMADHTNWESIAKLFDAVSDAKQEALIAGYVRGMLEKIMASVSDKAPEVKTEVRDRLMMSLRKYADSMKSASAQK